MFPQRHNKSVTSKWSSIISYFTRERGWGGGREGGRDCTGNGSKMATKHYSFANLYNEVVLQHVHLADQVF